MAVRIEDGIRARIEADPGAEIGRTDPGKRNKCNTYKKGSCRTLVQ